MLLITTTNAQVLLPFIFVVAMSYDDTFYAIVRAAAREVALQSQAAYWLLAKKNQDLISILADMKGSKREKWIQEQVLPSYTEAQWYAGALIPRIQYSENELMKAVELNDKREREHFKGDLVVLGESYLYWTMLIDACRNIFDAVWKLGTTIPVPDFDRVRDDQESGGFMAVLQSQGARLHRRARATLGRMDQDALPAPQPDVSDFQPVPQREDPRQRPLDAFLDAEQRAKLAKQEEDDFMGQPIKIRGMKGSEDDEDEDE